ncbi:hypothetical protein [Bdellovibrio sp. HCB209]|uniref:hypothetical protein n=1 Tax=Bdellovibrio sp. HCB209 TaxID=3394354 RepID=UPI0039B6BDC6
MEPELERNRSNPRAKPPGAKQTLRGRISDEINSQSEVIRKGQLQGVIERKTYAQETGVVTGILLVTTGLIGTVVDNFLGAHLSLYSNLIFFITGGMLVWAGLSSEVRAKKFSFAIGSFYAVLGVLGFIVGTPGMPTIGRIVRDDSLWLLVPEHLEFGTRDHAIHLLIAAALFCGAVLKFNRRRREEL